MSSQESPTQRPTSPDQISEHDDTLYLEWQSHCLPVMAIDDRYFVVEHEALAQEWEDRGDAAMQAGAIVLDRRPAGSLQDSGAQRINVRFFVDDTHDRLVRCRFGQLDTTTQDALESLRNSIQVSDEGRPRATSQGRVSTTAEKPKDQRPKRKLRSAILAGGLFAGCLAIFSTAKPEPKTVTFSQATIATQSVALESTAEGQVSEVLVQVGDTVHSGDAIAQLKVISDNKDAEVITEEINDGNRQLILLEQERVALEKTIAVARRKAELDQASARAALDLARATLSEEKAKLRRLAPLILDGNIGDAEVDQIHAVIAKAKANAEQHQIELQKLSLVSEAADEDILVTPDGVKPMAKLNAEITQLRAKVQRLTAQRSRMKFEPAETMVLASDSGVVQAIHLDAGSNVRLGDKALTVSKTNAHWANGLVDADSASQIKIGQSVSVQMPQKDISVQGIIHAIGDSPAGESVPVRVSLEGIDAMIPEEQLASDTLVKISVAVEQPSRLSRWMSDLRSPDHEPAENE